MSDLRFTDWICSIPERHWLRRMISANGTIDMLTWVSLYEDNLIYYHPNYEDMSDNEVNELSKKDDNRVWIVIFGDKLQRFQDLYEEMYGNGQRVVDVKSETILANIDSFLNRVVILNIFT